VDRFSLEGISGANAVFNPEKLDWFNQQHMMRLAAGDIAHRIAPLLQQAGLWRDSFASTDRAWLERIIELLKPRVKRLGQFAEDGRLFFVDEVDYDPAAVKKFLQPAGVREHLAAFRATLETVVPFEAGPIEASLRSLAEARGVKPAALIHATRVSVTGKAVSPGLFEVVELLGRPRTVRRLETALSLAAV
jgi:glutamyl-tRNA synthetase